MDTDGKVVFKVKLGDEIKKIVIHNEDINFNELLLMMQRIFSEKIKPNDEFSMKYTDEENDLVTLANDSDVSLALQTSKILKLTLFLKETEDVQEALSPNEIVKELQNIRLSIDRFLEKFATSFKFDTKPSPINDSATVSAATESATNGHQHPVRGSMNVESHKEFDPLTKAVPDMNRLGVFDQQQQRSESVNSLELSASQKSFEGLKQPETPHYQQANMQTQQPMLHQPQAQLPHQQSFTHPQQLPNAAVTQPPSQLGQIKQQYPVHQQQQQYPLQTPPTQAQNKTDQGNQNFLQQQQQQQYYQQHQPNPQAFNPHQQAQMPPNMMNQPPSGQMFSQPQGMAPGSSNNPYAKPPGSSVLRPPSATQFYSQGYK